MATIVSKTVVSNPSDTKSVTINTTVSGTDTAVVAAMSYDSNAAITFTAMTCDGVAMTPIINTTAGSGKYVVAFISVGVATGARDVVFDWSGDISFNLTQCMVASLSGIAQVTPVLASSALQGNGSSITHSAMTSAVDSLILGFSYLNNLTISSVTEGANQTTEASNGANGVGWISSKTGTGATDDMSWAVSTQDYGSIAVVLDSSAAALTVTQTDTTPEDGVQQTLTTSGLTGTPTGTLAGKALTLSGTLPNLTYTLDVSAVEASEGMPRIGETSTVAITGNEGTATTDVVIQPKTGWTRTVLAGTLDKSANGFLATLDAQLGVTSAVGDIIYFDASSNAAITATGVYTSDLASAGQKTDFVIQQGGSATTTATSEGGSFYPYGLGGSASKSTGISMAIRIGL